MAQRRMFSKTVTDSARFLRMPMEARLLYYDLGMAADDDGCAEGYTVLLKTGVKEEYLRLLEEKGFLKVLNEDLVVYLLDWGENNRIRKDRYHRSAYRDLVEALLGPQTPPCELPQEDGGPTSGGQPNDNQTAANCQPTDNLLPPEVRLGKVRLGQDRLGQDRLGQDRIDKSRQSVPSGVWTPPEDGPARARYGPYGNVELCVDEIVDLTNRIPDFDNKLKDFSAYLHESGKRCGSPYRAMLAWAGSG